MKPSCPTRTAPKVHIATFPAVPRPTPRNPNVGRNRNPIRRSGHSRMSAWATTPRVAEPASTVIFVVSHVPTAFCTPPAPKSAMKTPRPAIATTLLRTGAHM